MLKNLFPHAYIKNVFCIDYEKLFSFGYKALIFDIDNTLVHHGDEASNEVKTLFFFSVDSCIAGFISPPSPVFPGSFPWLRHALTAH